MTVAFVVVSEGNVQVMDKNDVRILFQSSCMVSHVFS